MSKGRDMDCTKDARTWQIKYAQEEKQKILIHLLCAHNDVSKYFHIHRHPA